jgi:hypothetical protein
MNLKPRQLDLIQHLCQFGTLDYDSCLRLLDTENRGDKIAASYAFRPLTKGRFLAKNASGGVTILAKGRALFPSVERLVTLGGGSRNRVNSISRTAMFLRKSGIEIVASPDQSDYANFVPSTCWRRIRHGILSTTRFAGMLSVGTHRLAVYDIDDGEMDWQIRAERSLFYWHPGRVRNDATGMLLICDEGGRIEIAKRIIRETMWQRNRLIHSDTQEELTRPLKYSRAPIRVAHYYHHAFLTTPNHVGKTLENIAAEKEFCANHRERSRKNYTFRNDNYGDFYYEPHWFFANLSCDLLKFVYFFSAVKDRNERVAIVVPPEDFAIAKMYPKLAEEVKILEYKHSDAHD